MDRHEQAGVGPAKEFSDPALRLSYIPKRQDKHIHSRHRDMALSKARRAQFEWAGVAASRGTGVPPYK